MDSVEEYARCWAKKEDVEVDTLSEWVKSVMALVKRRGSALSRTMSHRHESVFDDPDVAAELAEIHEKFVVVPANKASKNIVFVCKTHYINCLMEELGMSTMTGNPTYNLTAMSKDEILQNHHSVMLTFGISLRKEDTDLPKLYCRPRWLSWMRRPTGDQEVTGSTPAEVGNILSWRLIMKYFLRSFSPFR